MTEKMITSDEIDIKIKEFVSDDLSSSQLREIRLLCKELVNNENKRCHRIVQNAANQLI